MRIQQGTLRLFKDPRLSVVIRKARLRWAGHIARMDEICADLCGVRGGAVG